MRKLLGQRTVIAALFLCVATAVDAQQIRVASPVGGESWMIGNAYDIAWEASGVSDSVVVEVFKRKTTGDLVSFSKADSIPAATGEWTWNIPYEMPLGACFVKVSAMNDEKVTASSGDFSIVDNPAPWLKTRAPVGGETWAVGTAHSVSWDARNLSGDIQLELSKAGTVVMTVAHLSPGARRHTLTLPYLTPGDDYVITLWSAADNVASSSGAFTVSATPPATKEWTFMIYLDADNNLEEFELNDFLTIGEVGSDTHINLVAQVDRCPAYDTRFGNWADTKRYYLSKGIEPTAEAAVQDLGEVDIADSERLADFLHWAMDNYPAKRYLFVFSDHGLGWEVDGEEYDNLQINSKTGACRDDTNGRLWLSDRDIQQGINAAPSPLNIIGFDTCDMDMIEVAYQLRNTGAKVFIGSQNGEDYFGWDYTVVLNAIKANPTTITEKEIGVIVCDSFMERNEKYCPDSASTQAALDLSQMDPLATEITALADAMTFNSEDRDKVKTAASAVIDNVNRAVIRERHSKLMNGSIFGMNIYFPDKSISPKYTAASHEFIANTTWKTFLEAYFKNGMASTWIGQARANLWEEDAGYGHIDIIGFCRGLAPAENDTRITVSAYPSEVADLIPHGTIVLKRGETAKLEAALKDLTPAPDYHFARWSIYGDSTLDSYTDSHTVVTAVNDSSVTAIFSQNKSAYTVSFLVSGDGSISGETAQVVASEGDCSAVTAVPAAGHVFSGWSGDYIGKENPLTLTKIISDMNVAAVFADAPYMTIESVQINLDNKKDNKDKLTIKNATYPAAAPTAVQSAAVTLENALVFDCPAGAGWTLKKGVYAYSGGSGDATWKLTLDTVKKTWQFSASKLSATAKVNPLDGLSIGLTVNGTAAGESLLPYETLLLKSQVRYPR